jgi:hypothetical protein
MGQQLGHPACTHVRAPARGRTTPASIKRPALDTHTHTRTSTTSAGTRSAMSWRSVPNDASRSSLSCSSRCLNQRTLKELPCATGVGHAPARERRLSAGAARATARRVAVWCTTHSWWAPADAAAGATRSQKHTPRAHAHLDQRGQDEPLFAGIKPVLRLQHALQRVAQLGHLDVVHHCDRAQARRCEGCRGSRQQRFVV